MPVGYSKFHRKSRYGGRKGRGAKSYRGSRKNVSSLSRKFGRRAGKYVGRKRMRPVKYSKSRRARTSNFRGNVLYKSILKHGLTQQAIEMDTYNGTITKAGNNQQGTCQWLALAMETTPAVFDRILSASSNVAIGSVSLSQQVFLESVSNYVDMRNAGGHDCILTVYKCVPRFDIPISEPSVYGSNPQQLIDGFTHAIEENKATSPVAYTDMNATPYMSTSWCSMFKVKPIMRKFMRPGVQVRIKYRKNINYIVKKSKHGLINTASYEENFEHTRRNGPIYLFKVEGTVVHDSALLTIPTTSTSSFPSGTESTYKATTGSFIVDWLYSMRTVYRSPYLTPTRSQGSYHLTPDITNYTTEKQYLTTLPSLQSV